MEGKINAANADSNTKQIPAWELPSQQGKVPDTFQRSRSRYRTSREEWWDSPAGADAERTVVRGRPTMLTGRKSESRPDPLPGPPSHPSSRDSSSSGPSQSREAASPSAPPRDAKQRSKNQFGAREAEDPAYDSTNPHAPTSINAVYNSEEAKDVTVRMELDVSKDLGDELEILNRLSRTGNFSLGKEFFDSHLKAHVDDPAVFVQYAEMLLEQGDFKSLLLLDDKPIFSEYRNKQLEESESGIHRLELNWKLIRAVALCHSQHTLSSVWEGIDLAAKVVPSALATNSTELKIFSLAVRLRELTRTETIFNLDEKAWTEWTDWHAIYRKLLSEDRIWDFRDVFFALSVSRSTKDALAELLDSASPSDQMLADWETDVPDESTNLALLEILSFMALNAKTHPGILPFAGECMRSAEHIGNSILNNFPHAVHTRPFLQWVVAKALFNSSIPDFEHLLDYPGQVFFHNGEELPYYIPVRQENPQWLPRNLTAIARESLTMALSSFQHMQDYQSEAWCLKELALGTKAPEGLLDDLAHLQKSKQLDKAGYLSTCLSRYLTCNDESSKASLLRDLETFGWWNDPANVIDPNSAAARDVLQRALSLNDANGATKSMEAALRYYQYLDASFAETIDRNISPLSGEGLQTQESRENVNVDEQKAEEEVREQMRLEGERRYQQIRREGEEFIRAEIARRMQELEYQRAEDQRRRELQQKREESERRERQSMVEDQRRMQMRREVMEDEKRREEQRRYEEDQMRLKVMEERERLRDRERDRELRRIEDERHEQEREVEEERREQEFKERVEAEVIQRDARRRDREEQEKRDPERQQAHNRMAEQQIRNQMRLEEIQAREKREREDREVANKIEHEVSWRMRQEQERRDEEARQRAAERQHDDEVRMTAAKVERAREIAIGEQESRIQAKSRIQAEVERMWRERLDREAETRRREDDNRRREEEFRQRDQEDNPHEPRYRHIPRRERR